MMRQPQLYSYVVEHDTGRAPNPYFGVCTLCRCKFRECSGKPRNVVELAEVGDWIVGTGGANPDKSAGHGRLVYAMRVDKKLTREEYYADRKFARKKPREDGTDEQKYGDNKPPTDDFEKHDQFALISRHFYYFGEKAKRIPKKFAELEKKGPGFKKQFDASFINSFVRWLEHRHEMGKKGEPWMRKPDGSSRCKWSC